MTANELRIGNWIRTIYGMEFQVYPMDFKQMPTDEKHNLILSTWEPIPLTEEWLLKFGFELDLTFESKAYWKHDKLLKRIYLPYHIYDTDTCAPVKYVHQLQNLYFALTGEEITWKK